MSEHKQAGSKFDGPDAEGHFGPYGGIFVGETLIAAVEVLAEVYDRLSKETDFWAEYDADLKHYVGRPSPLYHAQRLSKHYGGAQIYLKREDLNHTGAHKINNTIGQALLAKYMGKTRIIAETGAGQHGVATATVAARLGLECHVYMGADDIVRQSPNVFRMKLLGANVVSVNSGSRTLKDALNEALRDWATNVDNTYYILGTVGQRNCAHLCAAVWRCVAVSQCVAGWRCAVMRQPNAGSDCAENTRTLPRSMYTATDRQCIVLFVRATKAEWLAGALQSCC